MFGKHFESMYEGSMYGAGLAVFAVWGYVIAHTRKGKVELNPRKLSHTLGGEEEEILKAIKYLVSPDKESRHKAHEGRRLLKEGEFQYSVPSWESYQGIRNADDRRAYNAAKQREYRAKKNGTPLAGEQAFVKAEEAGLKPNAEDYGKPLQVADPENWGPDKPVERDLQMERRRKLAHEEQLRRESDAQPSGHAVHFPDGWDRPDKHPLRMNFDGTQSPEIPPEKLDPAPRVQPPSMEADPYPEFPRARRSLLERGQEPEEE